MEDCALVTGVAGFVGSSVAERLLLDGWRVCGVDCFTDYYPRARKEQNLLRLRKLGAAGRGSFNFVEGDLALLDVGPLLHGVRWVFHQAAQAGVRASWGNLFESYTRHNILATQRLLEGARACGSIQKLVYASSSSVYGDAERLPTSEDILPRPVSPYGVTKLAAEHLMGLYASQFGVPTVSLRYFTVFGPRQRPDMAFHRLIWAALSGDAFTLFGDGEQSRDFTYIDDVVAANLQAAQQAPPGAVYNIGGGTQATMNEVIALIEELAGRIVLTRQGRQAGDARHTSADTSRAQREILFNPQVKLRDGLRCHVEWLRAERAENRA